MQVLMWLQSQGLKTIQSLPRLGDTEGAVREQLASFDKFNGTCTVSFEGNPQNARLSRACSYACVHVLCWCMCACIMCWEVYWCLCWVCVLLSVLVCVCGVCVVCVCVYVCAHFVHILYYPYIYTDLDVFMCPKCYMFGCLLFCAGAHQAGSTAPRTVGTDRGSYPVLQL